MMRIGVAACAALLLPARTMPQGPAAGDVNRIRTVVLDAGHGGKDPGNLGTGRYKTTEKHVSPNVAKLLGKYITEAFPGCEGGLYPRGRPLHRAHGALQHRQPRQGRCFHQHPLQR
ncbi:MAG: N-acetylmuramoyl-L-alanine amidase [Flavobacteriales bacterium]|nr:N-acetylmuramoyl-L-alanine amidase [Flavobacteriales bacterium]